MSSHDYKGLGTAVRTAREARGWRQPDLADAAHVGLSSVQNVEGGRPFSRVPSSYRKIEAALGWADGSFFAILTGGEPTPIREQAVAVSITGADAGADALAQSVADAISTLPLTFRHALTEGEVYDTDVIKITIGGRRMTMAFLVKDDEYDTEEKRAAVREEIEAWARMKKGIRQLVDEVSDDPSGTLGD